jgi:hypothetical protein
MGLESLIGAILAERGAFLKLDGALWRIGSMESGAWMAIMPSYRRG